MQSCAPHWYTSCVDPGDQLGRSSTVPLAIICAGLPPDAVISQIWPAADQAIQAPSGEYVGLRSSPVAP